MKKLFKEFIEEKAIKNLSPILMSIGTIVGGVLAMLLSIFIYRIIVNIIEEKFIISIVSIILFGILICTPIGMIIGIYSYSKRYINKDFEMENGEFVELGKREKRKLKVKIGINFALIVAISIFLIGSPGRDSYTRVVLDSDTGYGSTLGESFESFLRDYNAKHYKAENNMDVVNVKGKAMVKNIESDLTFQFIVNSENVGDYNLHALEINGVPQTELVRDSFFKTICSTPLKDKIELDYNDQQSSEESKKGGIDKESVSKQWDKTMEDLKKGSKEKTEVLNEFMYGDWASDDGSELTIDENSIGGNPYTVENKKGDMYIVKVNADGGYKIGIKSTDKGIMIYTYNEETKSFVNGINYYNTGI